MTLYIDIDNKKLVQSLTSDRTVATPVFMQGDNEPLELHLLEKGTENLYTEKALIVGTDFLRVAIARFKGYPKSLTYASGYTLNPNGGAEIVLPLNTTAIENAVQDNEYISAFLEVEYSNTSGKIVTVLQTTCRVKNDLIDNAPSVDLQDQFYDKVYTDEIFSKKSANLSDLADKGTSRTNLSVYSKAEADAQEALNLKKASNLSDLASKLTARTNLDVYGKSETYNKTEIDTQEALNLKKASNLSDVANKATSRTNLEVYSKTETDAKYPAKASNLSDMANISACRTNLKVPYVNDLSSLGVAGIISASNLTIVAPYGCGIGDDFPNTETKITFLTTYLPKGQYGATLFYPYYSDYGYFYPVISADGLTFSLGTVYDENYETSEITVPISKAIEFGDKIALTVDGLNVKLYKGIELVASGAMPEGFYVSNPANFLSWKGLKKDLIYSCSMILPLTSAEGVSSKIGYSVEDYVNGIYPSRNLLNARFYSVNTTFPSGYTVNGYNVKGVGGAIIGGKTNNLKLSLTTGTYSSSKEYSIPSANCSSVGLKYRIKFLIYLPTGNPNITKVQLRINSYALSSGGTIISKTANIDNSGFILPKDEWQTVDVAFTAKYTGPLKLYFYKGNANYYQIESETTDAVYLREIYAYGLQGIEGFFLGCSEAGIWKNNGASIYDLMAYDGLSIPSDGAKVYTKTIQISSFTNYTYEYFENFPSNMELSQIILRFDSSVPDTSNAEEETSKNVFRATFDGIQICEEQIPAMSANYAYNIYPKFGPSQNFYSLEIQALYACPCGGTIDLIFTKRV